MFRNLLLFTLLSAMGAHAIPVPQAPGPAGLAAPDFSKHGTCTEDKKGFYNGDKVQVVPEGTQCEGGYLVYWDW